MDLERVGFEVFTAVVMKSIIFWDMTPCSLLSCTRRFGGTYRLHLQGTMLCQDTSILLGCPFQGPALWSCLPIGPMV
jgi:hypothetical protein